MASSSPLKRGPAPLRLCSWPEYIEGNCILSVKGTEVHVNKTYLSMHSPIFHRMFDDYLSKPGNYRYEVNDVDKEAFIEMLRVILPCRKRIDENNVDSVLLIADRFQMDHLRKECIAFVCESAGFPCWKVQLLVCKGIHELKEESQSRISSLWRECFVEDGMEGEELEKAVARIADILRDMTAIAPESESEEGDKILSNHLPVIPEREELIKEDVVPEVKERVTSCGIPYKFWPPTVETTLVEDVVTPVQSLPTALPPPTVETTPVEVVTSPVQSLATTLPTPMQKERVGVGKAPPRISMKSADLVLDWRSFGKEKEPNNNDVVVAFLAGEEDGKKEEEKVDSHDDEKANGYEQKIEVKEEERVVSDSVSSVAEVEMGNKVELESNEKGGIASSSPTLLTLRWVRHNKEDPEETDDRSTENAYHNWLTKEDVNIREASMGGHSSDSEAEIVPLPSSLSETSWGRGIDLIEAKELKPIVSIASARKDSFGRTIPTFNRFRAK